ncbi:MAG: response regulator [candidate division Zixibacteria bacterium]|nr:response regulator [candidate division Zixibacteria bacterium]
MSKAKILVVEDEKDILELITYNLSREGYQVQGVDSGESAMLAVKSTIPDLILLDLMLPGVDGLDICRFLRNRPDTLHVPIIMVTAKGEDSDIVAGLELGADDYVIKPFSPRVLLARVKAVLRRTEEDIDEDSSFSIYDLKINPGRHEVLFQNNRIDLTSTEFRLLQLLARRPGWVFTRYQIVDSIHGDDYPVTDRSVDVQVVGLRKKLGGAGAYIETVRGVGYRFKDA